LGQEGTNRLQSKKNLREFNAKKERSGGRVSNRFKSFSDVAKQEKSTAALFERPALDAKKGKKSALCY